VRRCKTQHGKVTRQSLPTCRHLPRRMLNFENQHSAAVNIASDAYKTTCNSDPAHPTRVIPIRSCTSCQASCASQHNTPKPRLLPKLTASQPCGAILAHCVMQTHKPVACVWHSVIMVRTHTAHPELECTPTTLLLSRCCFAGSHIA
jgi:hypothetical protein